MEPVEAVATAWRASGKKQIAVSRASWLRESSWFQSAIQVPVVSGGSVWLVDPLGNLILRYPPGYQSRGLLEDLKRLLKLSKIG